MVVLVCTLVSAGSAAWSSWEARRNNDFSQRNASSAAITGTNPSTVDPDGCVSVPDEKTPLVLNGTAKLANGATLWEITQGIDSSLYPGPKATMNADSSSWSMTIPNIGGPTDRGYRYTILLVSATPNASHELNPAASAVGDAYKPLQKLPDGTEIVGQVCVRRAA